MDDDNMNDATRAALQAMHPDPFTQVAIWRLYRTAPELLALQPLITLHQANPPTTTLKD